ncbi:MAG: hypothetical protein JKY89_03615 [Immundisolibacteraceae bacterium]|nr:hypothetical protein [Immundisolibacteraceae bacterium]
MAYRLIYPDSYIRRAKKFFKNHPDLINQYRKALLLLELDPHHPSLRLHRLEGRMKMLSSISINMSYRVIIQIEADLITLINIGDHTNVY